MTPVIEARGLARHYPVTLPGGLLGRRATLRAVDGVDITVAPGRTLGLVGESGCGKTTTARLAMGLEPASAGSIRFEGQNLPAPRTEAWRRLRQRMQMVYQDPLAALDRRMPILEQVAEPLAVFGVGNAAERRSRAAALLAEVGLAASLHARYPHELSGGQRQRVVIARALINEPALLVCDEPVSALDVSIQAQVINLLADIKARRGVAMLFISHDLRVVRHVSDEVAVMYLGRIVEQGPPEALFRTPAHPYTQALVAAVPTVASARARRAHQARPRAAIDGDPPNPVDRPSGCAFHPRCPLAIARCREESPLLQPFDAGRRVACHRPGEGLAAAGAGASHPHPAAPADGPVADMPDAAAVAAAEAAAAVTVAIAPRELP